MWCHKWEWKMSNYTMTSPLHDNCPVKLTHWSSKSSCHIHKEHFRLGEIRIKPLCYRKQLSHNESLSGGFTGLAPVGWAVGCCVLWYAGGEQLMLWWDHVGLYTCSHGDSKNPLLRFFTLQAQSEAYTSKHFLTTEKYKLDVFTPLTPRYIPQHLC